MSEMCFFGTWDHSNRNYFQDIVQLFVSSKTYYPYSKQKYSVESPFQIFRYFQVLFTVIILSAQDALRRLCSDACVPTTFCFMKFINNK